MVRGAAQVGLGLRGARGRRTARSDALPTLGDPRMDDSTQRRLCDGLTGAGAVAGVAALAVGAWRGALVCVAVVVIAQVLRSSIGS